MIKNKETYGNGVSVRLDNRRVTVIRKDGKIGVEIRNIVSDGKVPRGSELVRGKMAVTVIWMTEEAAQALLIALAGVVDNPDKAESETVAG